MLFFKFISWMKWQIDYYPLTALLPPPIVLNDDHDDGPDKIPTHHLGFCPLGFCLLGFIAHIIKMKMKMKMEVGDDDGYLVMKVIQSWKLSCEESYLVMKVIIVERNYDFWRFACGDVSSNFSGPWNRVFSEWHFLKNFFLNFFCGTPFFGPLKKPF